MNDESAVNLVFLGKLLKEYRAAVIKAFEAGANLKREGYNPPKINLDQFVTSADTEFSGWIGLDVNGLNIDKRGKR